MLRIALQKMWHKKWMNMSLLIGCILLIGTVVSFPLYQSAAYDRMLQDEFVNVITEDGKWPAVISADIYAQKDKSGTVKKIEDLMSSLSADLHVTEKEKIYNYTMTRAEVSSDLHRADAEGQFLKLAGMTGLSEHVDIISGEDFSESGMTKDGAIEVIVSEKCMIEQGLLLNEGFEFVSLNMPDKKPVRIVIKGVFKAKDPSDVYWQVKANDMLDVCFMKMDLFEENFAGDNAPKYSYGCKFFLLFEYDDIKYGDVNHLISRTNYYTEKSKFKSVINDPDYMITLDNYSRKINRIKTTLIILQVPVLIMLCAFLFMISGQMYEMEKNEISVIKSRGSSREQIFLLYLYQSMTLVVLGTVLGTPLGMLFARFLGATRNFLEFDFSELLTVEINSQTLFYGGMAILLCLMSLTIPAIKHSKVSTVALKQSRAKTKKPLWQKLFIDVLFLGISLYGYYSFHKNMGDLSSSVLQGDSLDPLLYISSSLFILGAGLLFLRLHPYIISVIYKIGKKRWKPANYVSFTETIRNGRKMQLIMLFMIMTISLGIYHATVARTILSNALENREYLDSVDVVIKENWPISRDPEGNVTGVVEPNFRKYQLLPWAQGVTKVIYQDDAYLSKKKNDRQNVVLMGIHTREFGEITGLSKDLNGKNYRLFLNELAVEPNGIIVSRNFNTEMGLEVGDSITYRSNQGSDAQGTILDFVDYWPGYAPSVNDLNPDGTSFTRNNFLIVANYETLRKKWGTTPYEVWISMKEGFGPDTVYEFIEDNNIEVRKYINLENDMEATMRDPLLQGTNGILTLGFVVTIVLCAIGYLIYWIMVIRERELMFGVLRASGFHKGELVHLLINEQLFTGLFSVLVGIGIGNLTSHMFVPILQQAYASEDQVLPMKLIQNAADLYRLYGIVALALVVSLFVLTIILFRMNVSKALKLGEE